MMKVILKILLLLIAVSSTEAGTKIHPGYYAHTEQKHEILADGVVYRHIKIGQRETKHSVRVIECDLTNQNIMPVVLKAGQSNYTTSKIQNMIIQYDSLHDSKVVAAINANFWRAYTLYPIGPTIVDGEIIEKYRYKKWSSMFFDSNGTPYIDTFDIKVTMICEDDSIDIHRVNRRYDTNLVCMYNKYYGETLPRVLEKDINEFYEIELETAILDTAYQDSTEIEFDSLALRKQIIESQQEESFEFSCAKIRLEYLDSPGINTTIECLISAIDTNGTSNIPENGCVISMGRMSLDSLNIKVGDIIKLKTETNCNNDVVFLNSICGTPRLVRAGVAKHEAYQEGSTGRRFIRKRLTRTACGYNEDKTKFYFVVCDPNSRGLKRKAANLEDMAAIMKSLGCYEAINLDGGGSSYMVVDGENVTYRSNPMRGRKVSVALGIILLKL